jgi:hypothetical protein
MRFIRSKIRNFILMFIDFNEGCTLIFINRIDLTLASEITFSGESLRRVTRTAFAAWWLVSVSINLESLFGHPWKGHPMLNKLFRSQLLMLSLPMINFLLNLLLLFLDRGVIQIIICPFNLQPNRRAIAYLQRAQRLRIIKYFFAQTQLLLLLWNMLLIKYLFLKIWNSEDV